MHCQPIPVLGISSDLEVAMERCYNKHVMDTATQQKKKELQEKPGPKPALSSKPSRLKNRGCRETIKLHLQKKAPGQDWTHVPPKDDGPDIRKCYKTPRRQESTEPSQVGCSPLTEELLALGEDVTIILDNQYDMQEDPEIVQEMEDVNVTTGFEPKVGHLGYDVNLMHHSDNTVPGSISPVTAQESQMLDEDSTQTKAPGTGRQGTEENTGHPITNKKK